MASLRTLTLLPVAALAGLLVLSLVAPAAAERLALPLAVIGVVLGVPHGAVDHLVPWWWGRSGAGRRPAPAVLAAFVVGYVAIAGAALACSLLAPAPTFVVFLVVSALHFGRGEVVTSAERAGRPLPHRGQEWSTTLAPGLVVVGLLLWARPERTAELLQPLSPGLARAVPAAATIGLAATAAAVVLALAVQLRRRRHLDAGELVLMTATFAVAPPLAAFGVWFGLWHAVRHTGRLLDLARTDDAAAAPTSAQWWAALRRLTIAGALPTAVALAAIVAMWLLRDVAGLQAEVAILLALTFPHAAVVWALDRHEAARPVSA
ncbi:MAG TPA: Brp/Blh family beta-carotene 15,15'-dioxygenase [Actinomycetales bacterium]